MNRIKAQWFLVGVVLYQGLPALAADSFVNWESPHVHPLELTPDRQTLLAVNTADNRLEVFRMGPMRPIHVGSIPVGLDPVSVRARSNTEAWVVNHISDSVSIVNLNTLNVVKTLRTDDEPADVVFAGSPADAFVSCSQANTILVFDADNPQADIHEIQHVVRNDALVPPPAPAGITRRIRLEGEDPRMLAVSRDGSQVYVAIFESGNRSTILGGGDLSGGTVFAPNVVSDPLSPYFDPDQDPPGNNPPNPPPNDGNAFNPPINPDLPNPPAVGLIVKRVAGQWMDDNDHNWTDLVSGPNAAHSGRPVGWELLDHDVAVITVSTLGVRYSGNLMNICMALAVHPATDRVTVVGTDATNEVRFEPVLNGRFLRVNFSSFNPAGPANTLVADLNSHLAYSNTIPFVPVPQSTRDRSVGDPRGIVWSADGARGYVTGMGSNNVVVIDSNGARILTDPIVVGEGPTGIVLNEPQELAYVLNKFEATISILDLGSNSEILPRLPLYDPSPPAIKIGRKHLYDTHRNSGLGHVSCASCHVDARADRIGWDLGNPLGEVKSFDQNCNGVPGAVCNDWHPMKGPMVTQTLQDIVGHEPHHWRGDRTGIEEFADAFEGLLGDDQPLPDGDMQEFEDFLATLHFPPNPFRNFDNSLPADLPLSGHFSTGRFELSGGLTPGASLPNGNALNGLARYREPGTDGVFACVSCHTLPTGMGMDGVFFGNQFTPLPLGPDGEHHLALFSADGSTNRTMKIAQLRNLYEKTGFDLTQSKNIAGFGFLHDGSVDSIARFVSIPLFNIDNDQDVADLVAFMLAFSGSDLPEGDPTNSLEPPGPPSQDAHAAVGRQATLAAPPIPASSQSLLIADMIDLANDGAVGVVVKGVQDGIPRGYTYIGMNLLQSDRANEQIALAALQSQVGTGEEITFTVVPDGTQPRIGVDRDEDGYLDRDELDYCSDPADPGAIPLSCPLHGDLTIPSCVVDIGDVLYVLDAYGDLDPCTNFPGADLSPCAAPCSLVDISDVISILGSYAGNYECINPCPQSPF